MKSSVKLKVKHLVMIAFTVFLIFPLAMIFLIPQIELGLVKYKHSTGITVAREQVIELLESNIFPSQKYSLIQNHLLGGEWLGDYDIYVGPTMSTSIIEEESQLFSWEEKKPYLNDYLENGPVDYPLINAAVQLAAEAVRNGDEARAEGIYKLAKERLNHPDYSYLISELELSFVKLYIQSGNPDKAENFLETIDIHRGDFYYQAEKVKYEALILLHKGENHAALTKVKEGMTDFEKAWDAEGNEDSIEYSAVYEDLERLNYTIDSSTGELTTVSGNISRKDGTPIAQAGVFLRESSMVNRSVGPDEFYQVTTDDSGNFEFQNVVAGSYQIFVGFHYDQIDGYTWPVDLNDWIYADGGEITYDITLAPLMEVYEPVNGTVLKYDEIEFSWEPVSGAAYYTLQFSIIDDGLTYSLGLDMEARESTITIPVESIYNLASSSIMGVDDTEWEYFNPAYYLGFENSHGVYSWSVQAFDEKGNLITRSDGYRLAGDSIGNLPILYLQQRELTKADEWLIEGKLEEALRQYKEDIEVNPKDTHSLRMITRIIGIQADGDYSKLLELQLPYYKQLIELTGDPSYIFWVLDHYYRERDWRNYQIWFEKYKAASKGGIDPFVKSYHANALMFQGEYKKAAELHKEAIEAGGDHRYIGNLLALEIYLGADFEKVIELANVYPYHEHIAGSEGFVHWASLLQSVKKDVEADEEALKMLKQGLKLYFTDEQAELENWKQKTSKSNFVKLINLLEVMN